VSKASVARVYRRQVKRGMIEEIKRRTGRDASSSSEVRKMIQERIREKERQEALPDVDVPRQ